MSPAQLFEQLVAEIIPGAIYANDPIPQMTFAEVDHMRDELSFRHHLKQVAILPGNVCDLFVAHRMEVTPENDPQRWN